MSSNNTCSDTPHLWVREIQDSRQSVTLFTTLYILYLMGQFLLAWVAHRHKLRQIHAENGKRIQEFKLRAQIAEAAARSANLRVEQYALQLRETTQRAEELEQQLRLHRPRRLIAVDTTMMFDY